MDHLLVEFLQALFHRAWQGIANLAAIDFSNRHHTGKGAGAERFIGTVGLAQTEILFKAGDIVTAADFEHIGAGNTAQTVIAR